MPEKRNTTEAHEEELSRLLIHTLGEKEVELIARETGWLVRLRAISPLAMVSALVSTLGGGRVAWLADMLRTLNALTGRPVQYKPFHNQLSKAAFPEFMRRCFERVLNKLTRPVLTSLPRGKLSRFRNILIHDGSSYAVKDSLAKTWPGRFTKVSPAAVELHVTMSAFEDNPVRVSLTADKESERPYAPEPDEVADCLLLQDRGFEHRMFFQGVIEARGFYIVRGKKNIRPKILKAFDSASGARISSLEGKTLSFKMLSRANVDLDIEWGTGATTYRGRLVVIYKAGPVNKPKNFTYLHTNLDRAEFSAIEVGQLYRLRWQVELLFKEWKSYANLHAFDTSKPTIAEGLIWASLMAATLKRAIAHAAEAATGVELSTQRVAMSANHYLHDVMRSLWAGGQTLASVLRHTFKFFAANTRRAHPGRDRKRGRLASGLTPLLGS